MTAPHPSPPDRPKVTLAMPDGALRQRLVEVLQRADIDVEVRATPQSRGGAALPSGSPDADLLVVRPDDLDTRELDELTRRREKEQRPGVAVVGHLDPEEQVRVLAAGASTVIDEEDDREHIAEALETVAEAEHEGGIDGPEVAGMPARPRLADFQSRSPRMQEFLGLVERVVDADTSLLVTGPTGVGKERLARAIHAESRRAQGPFVAVNCGALPEQLLESELFGHERGAFTGAERRRRGHFEAASGGTIFLDEIGEVPLHLQVKLLTVLQRHEIQRVGSEETIPVDVRVITATNRDLAHDVSEGKFREDLYYRLNVVHLEVPALRERREDIPDLVGRFIHHFRSALGGTRVRGVSRATLEVLCAYDWPGNVRELINTIERAMLLGQGPDITTGDLPVAMTGGAAEPNPDSNPGGCTTPSRPPAPSQWLELPIKEVRERTVERVESEYLAALLTECGGHLAETARRAGLGPRALYDKMRRYGLRKEDFKPKRR